MNTLNIVAGAMFLAADIFAILSLAIPEWIKSSVGGENTLGILTQITPCDTRQGRHLWCSFI